MDSIIFKGMISNRDDYSAAYIVEIYNKFKNGLDGFNILHESIEFGRFDVAYKVLSMNPKMEGGEYCYYEEKIAEGITLDNMTKCEAWQLIHFFDVQGQIEIFDCILERMINSGKDIKERLETLVS